MKMRLPWTTCLIAANIASVVATVEAGADSFTITRAHLADRYIAVERAYVESDPSPHVRRDLHRRFDAAAAPFFVGNFPEAARRLTLLHWRIVNGGMPPTEWLALSSLHAEPNPRIWVIPCEDATGGDKTKPQFALALRQLFPISHDEEVELPSEIMLVDDADAILASKAITIRFVPGERVSPRRINMANVGDIDPGVYAVRISNDGGEPIRVGRAIVSNEPISAIRNRLLERTNAMQFDDTALTDALHACRARIRLLRDIASPTESAQFMLDPITHAAAVERDIAALEEGRNPYYRRAGDLWRTIDVNGTPLSIRQYAPRSNDPDEPRPLIIALHGAGGDENMFHDGYAAGLLLSLADEHGFIVAAPQTYPIMGDLAHFDRLLEVLRREYVIDDQRIYLLGHSLGAATSTMIANERSEQIAAIACIAGAGQFRPIDGQPYPSALVIAPEYDTIVPAVRLKRLSDAGRDNGARIEYRLIPDTAHLFIVSDVLQETIEWLRAQPEVHSR